MVGEGLLCVACIFETGAGCANRFGPVLQAEAVKIPDAELFLQNAGGTFFVYDWMRRILSLMSGKSFQPGHSDKFSE